MGKRAKLAEQPEVLMRTIQRERIARQKSEDLLESMARNIFEANQKLRDQNEELDLIHRVGAIVQDETRIREAIRKFLDLSVRFLDWPLAHVYVASREEPVRFKSTKIWAGSRVSEFSQFRKVSEEFEFLPNQGLPGKVAVGNTMLWLDDLRSNENFPRGRKVADLELRTAFGVPLALRGKVLAVFEYFHVEARASDRKKAEIIQSGISQLERLLERNQSQRELAENFHELKNAQNQLIQSEKMASLGIISAGVAHEINNPLSFILSNLESLKGYAKKIADYERAVSDLLPSGQLDELRKRFDLDYVLGDLNAVVEESLFGAFRVRDIVSGLKSFSHLDQEKPEQVDLVGCIQTTLKLLANEIKYHCEVTLELGSVPKIDGFPGQIVQVFTNLVLNSLQSMNGKRGKITIRTGLDETGAVRIAFQDNGSGIASDHLNKIFTPFFTTKAAGKGTGLGLYVSYGIVKAHQGDIQVRSVVGEGTEFELIFRTNRRVSSQEKEEESEW